MIIPCQNEEAPGFYPVHNKASLKEKDFNNCSIVGTCQKDSIPLPIHYTWVRAYNNNTVEFARKENLKNWPTTCSWKPKYMAEGIKIVIYAIIARFAILSFKVTYHCS